jgi:hypothetical protein
MLRLLRLRRKPSRPRLLLPQHLLHKTHVTACRPAAAAAFAAARVADAVCTPDLQHPPLGSAERSCTCCCSSAAAAYGASRSCYCCRHLRARLPLLLLLVGGVFVDVQQLVLHLHLLCTPFLQLLYCTTTSPHPSKPSHHC